MMSAGMTVFIELLDLLGGESFFGELVSRLRFGVLTSLEDGTHEIWGDLDEYNMYIVHSSSPVSETCWESSQKLAHFCLFSLVCSAFQGQAHRGCRPSSR